MKSPAVIALLFAGGIASGAQSPSEAAVEWLRDVASGEAEADLAGETAISPDTGEEDLKSIRSRISRLRGSLRPDDLKAVADKQDGEIAAVLVSQITNFDADSVQIHAVGLVKSNDKWLPAPLPASFNATGLSLRPGLLKRVQILEDWMLRTRSTQLVRLKDDAFSVLAEEMRKFKMPGTPEESSPEKLASRFLTALAARDLASMLAMMGGLENPRPADFDEGFQALARILRGKEITHPDWRLLAAPEAVRAIVTTADDGRESLVSIVALDPAGDFNTRPRPRAIHLPFVAAVQGGWRLRLPNQLLAPVVRVSPPGREPEDDAIDADLVGLFPEKLASTIPARPEPSSRAAAEAVIRALQEPSLAGLCARIEFAGKAEDTLATWVRAAQLWQRVHRPRSRSAPVLLEVKEEGDDACALVQMFSSRDPGKAAIETIFLHRKAEGWLANPGFSGAQGLLEVQKDGTISKWAGASVRAHQKDWSKDVLVKIGGIAADTAPSEAEAREAVGAWRAAIAEGDGARTLQLSACFDDETGSARLLKNTGYELAARQAGEILEIHRSGRWAAASLRVPPALGDDSADAYPLVVLAATAAGPRVLPELDLFDPLTRSREFLNRSVWDRVSSRLPEAALEELQSIYEKHRTTSASDRERRKKPTE